LTWLLRETRPAAYRGECAASIISGCAGDGRIDLDIRAAIETGGGLRIALSADGVAVLRRVSRSPIS